jgi:predicted nucleic-acid-binding Zn-ribbon protein
MQQQKPVQLKVSLDRTLALVCEECGSQAFQEALMLRKVSKFLTGDAQDGIIPIATFACVKCGHVNKEFYPKEIVELEKRKKEEEEEKSDSNE